MRTSKLHYLLGIVIAIICLSAIPLQSQAAPKAKHKASQQEEKERLVLMPLRVPEEDKNLTGAMETALVEGLQQKYDVFSGEQVSQKARQIFLKESRNTAHAECDETRCMQNIAEAFQAELIATANVTKQGGIYFLALSIQNIFDNKVVYSKSSPCKNCDEAQVVDKLKELSGAIAPVASAPAIEEPQVKVNSNDPDSVLWAEAQKGNTVEDYQVYLDTYPKGKSVPFAKARIKKLNDAAQSAAEQQEQQAWDAAQKDSSEESYGLYLKGYPTGHFAGLAKVRLDKLKNDVAAKEENSLWNKADSSNDQALIENYLSRYPAGHHIAAASAKLKAIKEEAAKGPAMVRIPGKNYEIGKYDVTQKEWRDIMGTNPSKFTTCGDNCPVEQVSWNDVHEFLQKLNAKTGRQYRLPIEEEWEYACYGGIKTEYCGGSNFDSVAWYKDNSNSTTHPVGQKQANGYGLYDMSGNVWQWMENKYDNEHDWRALRRGSWSYNSGYLRAANRFNYVPTFRISNVGFRLARTLP